MKKQFLKCLLVVISTMFFSLAKSQIVYTNVNPDISSTGSYNIDLNKDGISDFVILHSKPSGCSAHLNNYIRISPLNNNQVVSTLSAPKNIAFNETINASSTMWSNTLNQVLKSRIWVSFVCTRGNWATRGPFGSGYIGLKFIKNGKTYYGWVHVSVSAGADSFTITDYAYDQTPNHFILAGSTSGARLVNENNTNKFTNELNKIIVAPNPISNSTTISFTIENSENVSLKIFDLNGRLIKNLVDEVFETGEHSVEWYVENVNDGIYLLQVQSPGFFMTKKVIVTK